MFSDAWHDDSRTIKGTRLATICVASDKNILNPHAKLKTGDDYDFEFWVTGKYLVCEYGMQESMEKTIIEFIPKKGSLKLIYNYLVDKEPDC